MVEIHFAYAINYKEIDLHKIYLKHKLEKHERDWFKRLGRFFFGNNNEFGYDEFSVDKTYDVLHHNEADNTAPSFLFRLFSLRITDKNDIGKNPKIILRTDKNVEYECNKKINLEGQDLYFFYSVKFENNRTNANYQPPLTIPITLKNNYEILKSCKQLINLEFFMSAIAETENQKNQHSKVFIRNISIQILFDAISDLPVDRLYDIIIKTENEHLISITNEELLKNETPLKNLYINKIKTFNSVSYKSTENRHMDFKNKLKILFILYLNATGNTESRLELIDYIKHLAEQKGFDNITNYFKMKKINERFQFEIQDMQSLLESEINCEDIYAGFVSSKMKILIEFFNINLKKQFRRNQFNISFMNELNYDEEIFEVLLNGLQELIDVKSDVNLIDGYLCLNEDNFEKIMNLMIKNIQNQMQAYKITNFLEKNLRCMVFANEIKINSLIKDARKKLDEFVKKLFEGGSISFKNILFYIKTMEKDFVSRVKRDQHYCKSFFNFVTNLEKHKHNQEELSEFKQLNLYNLIGKDKYDEYLTELYAKNDLKTLLEFFSNEYLKSIPASETRVQIVTRLIDLMRERRYRLSSPSKIYVELLEKFKFLDTVDEYFRRFYDQNDVKAFLNLNFDVLGQFNDESIFESLLKHIKSQIAVKMDLNAVIMLLDQRQNDAMNKYIQDVKANSKYRSKFLSIVNLILENKPVVSVEDYFEHENSRLCILTRILKGHELLNIGYDSPYIERTNESIQKIKESIENKTMKIGYYTYFDKLNENNRYAKLEAIYQNYEEYKRFDDILLKSSGLINDILNSIEKIDQCFRYFFDDVKEIEEEKNQLNQLKTRIDKKILIEFDDEFKQFQQKLDKSKNGAFESKKLEDYCRLQKSTIFMDLFKIQREEHEKENSEKGIETRIECLTNAYKSLMKLKEVLVSKNLENYNDAFAVCQSFMTSNIDHDLKFLIEFFEIENQKNAEVIDMIKVVVNRNNLLSRVEKLKKLFELFEVQSEGFNKQMEQFVGSMREVKVNARLLVSRINDLNRYIKNLLENDTFFVFVDEIDKSQELVEFLKDKKEDDLRGLVEFVDDIGDSFIKVDTIRDLIRVLNFFLEVRRTEKKNETFLFELCDLLKKDNYTNVHVYLQTVISNINGIKQLYNKITNKEEFSKAKIKEIIDNGIFEVLFQNNIYTCRVKYGQKRDRECTFEDILQLRDRSLMLAKQRTYDNENNNMVSFTKNCDIFIKFVDSFSNLIHLCNVLFMRGCIGMLEDQKQNAYTIDDCKAVENEEKRLKTKLENVQNSILVCYEHNLKMRFFFGRQFELLYHYFRNERKIDKGKATQLISMYFNKNENGNVPKIAQEANNDGLDLNNYDFDSILRFLNSNLENYSLKHEDVDNQQAPGLYLFLASERDLELEILNVSLKITKSLPNSNNTLYCNQWTTIEQLTSFVYTGLNCCHKGLYLLINIEVLDSHVKLVLSTLITKLYKQYEPELRSIFLIFYYDRNQDFVNQIMQLKKVKRLPMRNHDLDELNVLTKQALPNVVVYTSDCCGLGKSTDIKTYAQQNKMEYILFPINGEVSLPKLIDRIDKLNISIDSVLHIDLGECTDLQELKYILFNLLVLNGLFMQEKWCYLPSKLQIKIELQYGYDNLMDRMQFLRLIECKRFEKNNKNTLIIPHDVNSKIQLVANYLKAYKEGKIENYNIYLGCKCPNGKHWEGCCFRSSIKATVLSNAECLALIKESFPDYDTCSFYKILSFINIAGEQFRCMSESVYFSVETMRNNGALRKKNILTNRKIFVDLFIDLTKYFTTCAYDNLVNAQESVMLNVRMKNNKDEIETLVNTKIISFDDLKDNFVFFNGDQHSISIICYKGKQSNNYQKLKDLFNSHEVKEELELLDYRNLSRNAFFNEVKKFLNVNTNVEDLAGSYVFTLDNFLKMVLIVLRTNSRIPVVMMGETGCGKTALFKVIAKLKQNSFLIFNVHAGTTDEDIVCFIEGKVLIEYEKFKKDLETANAKNEDNLWKMNKFWVFFDEINTCNSMGLITEIMVKNSYLGNQLPENIAFIAACNPYKKYKIIKGLDYEIGLRKEEHAVRKLVYNVKPLPYTLMNFVFDFGYPSLEDEKRYIQSMIESEVEDVKMKDYVSKTIIASHIFIREIENESYVTLRDIQRTILFYNWFKISIDKRNKYKLSPNHGQLYCDLYYGYLSTETKSLILSLFVNYCCRIVKKNDRRKLQEIIANILNINEDYLNKFIKSEQIDIVKRMAPPEGIALNQALLENVFTLFVCINTKVPIIICGKPGCSKSLSVQLIYSSMRGNDSRDSYLKTLPRLFMNSYQGSQTSTSAGVLKIFEKARNMINNDNTNEIISMVFFDEMGLAEISKNNPLKVIHYELEPDDKMKQVAFIGISNWRLDAAKMNRCIFVSRMDPDEEDLIETAITIAQSYQLNHQERFEFHFRNLARTYHEYKLKLDQDEESWHKDFHGTRDFYHLIKQVARELRNSYGIGNNEFENTIKSLQRNFGGIIMSVENVTGIFYRIDGTVMQVKKQDPLEMIKENLNDIYARYLLLIADVSTSQNLVSYVLTKKLEMVNFKTFIGSHFKNDMNKEDYSFKMLNKIQSCMEHGNILILKDLEIIYPSLYDLFNQNFSFVGGKKYSRIALGVSNNPMALVHDDFRCIILLDDAKIKDQDPPFLNRFEKQRFSFKNFIDDENIAREIIDFFKKMIEIEKDKITPINSELLINNSNTEEVYSRLFKLKLEEKNDNKYQKLLKYGAEILCQDLVALSHISVHKTDPTYQRDLKEMYEFYDLNSYPTFNQFINQLVKNKFVNSVIYTFSNVYAEINLDLNDNITFEIEEKLISSFETENEFESFISKPIENGDKEKLIILKFRVDDLRILNQVKFLIESLNADQKHLKMFLIFIHLKRGQKKLNSKELISHLSNWNFYFIDNLNQKDFYNRADAKEVKLTSILNLSLEDIIYKTTMCDTEEKLKSSIYKIFLAINYKCLNDEMEKDYVDSIIENIFKQDVIFENIKIKIATNLLENKWIEAIFAGDLITKNLHLSFLEIIEIFIEEKFDEILLKIFVSLERSGGLEFILYKESNLNNYDWIIQNIWKDELFNLNVDKVFVRNKFQENEVIKVLYQRIPFFNQCANELKEKTEKLCIQYQEYEDKLRECQSKDDYLEITKDNFIPTSVQSFEFSLKSSFKKLFDDYYSLESIEKFILEDYIQYFIAYDLKCKSQSKKEFLEFIISIKFNLTKLDSSMLSEVILWLNVNIDFIQSVNIIFDILLKYEPKLIDELNTILKDDLFKYPDNDKIKNISKPVNEPLYLSISALVNAGFVIIEKTIDKFDSDSFYAFSMDIAHVKQIVSNLNISKLLYNEELRDIEMLSNFFDFQFSQEDTIKYSKAFIQLLRKERVCEGDQNKLIDILKSQFEVFDEIINQSVHNKKLLDLVYDFVVKTMLSKYKKFRFPDYKYEVIKFLFSNENIIKNEKCIPIIEQMSKKIDSALGLEYSEDISEFEQLIEEFGDIENTLANDKITILLSQVIEKNQYLAEIFSYKFSIKVKNFLVTLIDENKLLDKLPLSYFEKSVAQLNEFYHKNIDIFTLEKLFHLEFIKLFSEACINQEKENNLNLHEFNQKLQQSNIVTKHLKIYILKLIRNTQPDFEAFKQFDFNRHQFGWVGEFKFAELGQNRNFEFAFLNYENKLTYNELQSEFIKLMNNNNDNKFQEIFLRTNDFNMLFDVVFNNLICFNLHEFIDSGTYKNFAVDHFPKLLDKLNLDGNLKSCLKVLCNLKSTLYPYLQTNQKDFEMLMIAFKFALIAFSDGTISFNSNVLKTQNSQQFFTNQYFVGSESENASFQAKLDYIKEMLDLNPNSETQASGFGVYLCSCGVCYVIQPCGRPSETKSCSQCQQIIGGTGHVLHKRAGHKRVYLNEKQKDLIVKTWPEDKNDYIYYAEMENELATKENIRGINITPFENFSSFFLNLRKMKPITFRVLNFYLNSITYFSALINLLEVGDVKTLYARSNKEPLDYLRKNWNKIEDLLRIDAIRSPLVFMNLAANELSKSVKQQPQISDNNAKIEFESQYNKKVMEIIANFSNHMKNYLDANNELFDNSKKQPIIKLMIEEQELSNMITDYNHINDFMLSTQPSIEELERKLSMDPRNQIDYPVLTEFLKSRHEIEKLAYLREINPFINEMLNTYSYKISRDDGYKLLIRNEKENWKIKFEKFQNAWNQFSSNVLQYKCHQLKDAPKQITENDSISYLLNDNAIEDHGMFIAGAYQIFIDCQNNFINKILPKIEFSGIAKMYKENLKREIVVQDANDFEILSTKLEGEFECFEELIETMSMWSKNNKQEIVYDFKSVEENLAKSLLPGKKRFKDMNMQRFITYAFEPFRGEKTSLLQSFAEKTPQVDLTDNEKSEVTQLSKDCEKLLSSLQILIFFYSQHQFNPQTPIHETLENLPEYITIEDKLKDYMREHLELTLSKLVSIYEIAEASQFSKSILTINELYKNSLTEDQKRNITKYLETEKKLSKEFLAKITRRFITRFLCGGILDFRHDNGLMDYLPWKEDLWMKTKNEDEAETIEHLEKIKDLNIEVGQANDFYLFLGKDEDVKMFEIVEQNIQKIGVQTNRRRKARANDD